MLTALTGADWELVRFYLSPIQSLLDDDQVTNVMVNRFDDIWADDPQRGMYRTALAFRDDAEVATLIEQIANALSQYFDPVKTPIINARLPDGSRVCATLPAATPAGCTLSIRLHRRRGLDLARLVETRTISAPMQETLLQAMARGANILVSGATNSGKTTLLNALSFAIPPQDRIVVCEDVSEIMLNAPNVIQMEAQQHDSEDTPALTLATLLATSLRQRPDRIIVGEIREPDAAEVFFQALNTGHRGICTTLHANNARAALKRLVSLTMGGSTLPFQVIETEYLHNLDLVLHMDYLEGRGVRRLAEICVVEAGALQPRYVYHDARDDWLEK